MILQMWSYQVFVLSYFKMISIANLKKKKRGIRKLLELIDITLIVMIVPHVYAYVQTHQVVHTKFVHFFVY